MISLAMFIIAVALSQADPAGICGPAPCAQSTDPDAKRMQAAWESPATTEDQRTRMRVIVLAETVGGAINWRAAAKSYFDWRSVETHELRATPKPDFRQMRISAEAAIRSRMIDPGSTTFEWPRGFVDGWWKPVLQRRVTGFYTCGYVNSKNRMGGYVGATPFAVVMQNNQAVFVDIGRGKDFDFITIQCNKAFQTLPPAPAEMFDGPKAEAGAGSSLADELSRLASLRDTGALTEAEFVAAKTKLLQK